MEQRISARAHFFITACTTGVLLWLTSVAGAQDALKQTAFRKAVSDCRTALSDRDIDAARRHQAVAADNAQTRSEHDEAERLQVIHDYAAQFWGLIQDAMGTLQATEELEIKDTRIAVVEASRRHLVVKAAGRVYRYRIETMPASLVMALAERSLAHDAVSKVAVGAFMAFDPKGDREVARKLWLDASKAGVDIRAIMPELDMKPSDEGLPVPNDQRKLKAAEQDVRQRFQAAYGQATAAAGRLDLARVLLNAGRAATDPVARFVMLREARDLATAAGDSAVTCEAIDELGTLYAIDELKMKSEALAEVAQAVRGSQASRELAQTSLGLAKRAVDAGRIEEAKQLAQTALAGARGSRNRLLMQQAAMAVRQIDAMGKKP